MQSIKLITWEASERVARYAFNYANDHGRNRVTAVHKANIMFVPWSTFTGMSWSLTAPLTYRKLSDGMFLTACRHVAKEFPNIKYDEDNLDRVCLSVRLGFFHVYWALTLAPDNHEPRTIL